MEAARSSDTSVNLQQTTRYHISGDSYHHSYQCSSACSMWRSTIENSEYLISHQISFCSKVMYCVWVCVCVHELYSCCE
jgi:hypothetical protein